MDADRLKERYKNAETHRLFWQEVWDDAIRLSMPMRSSIFSDTPGGDNMEDIVDETAIIAVDEFVSSMKEFTTPEDPWFRIEVGALTKPRDAAAAQAQLDEVTAYLMDEINSSNFGVEVDEAWYDNAIGTSTMLIDDGDTGAKFTNVPLNDILIDLGPFGEVDGRFRPRKVKLKHIKVIWPDAQIPPNLAAKIESVRECDQEIEVIECVYRNWEERGTETWEYRVFGLEGCEMLVEDTFTGSGSNPFVNFRWSSMAKEVYGRGPLIRTLPAIRLANLVQQLILENAEMQGSGVFQMDNDGSINVETIQIEPNTIIPVRPNSNGIRPVEFGRNFDLSQFVINEIRGNIRAGLLNEEFGSLDKTPISASEVVARQGRTARKANSPFGRWKSEWMLNFVKRLVYIYTKRGDIQMPRIDGKQIKVVSTSPMALASRAPEVTKMVQLHGVMGQVFGPQVAALTYNEERFKRKLAHLLGVDHRTLNSANEIRSIIKGVTKVAQANAQAANGPAGELVDAAGG